jgi:hypothetical protein
VRPWLAEPCICSSAHLLRSSACHFSRETEADGCIHCNRHLPACALDERRLVAMNAPQMKTLQELGRSPTRPDPTPSAARSSALPRRKQTPRAAATSFCGARSEGDATNDKASRRSRSVSVHGTGGCCCVARPIQPRVRFVALFQHEAAR